MMKPTLKFILIALLATIVAACKQNYTQQANPDQEKGYAIPVKTHALVPTSTPIPIEASGTVASKAEMSLSFKIGGIVDRIFVDEGQKVRKGQLLARLRTTEIDAQVMKAQQSAEKAKRDADRMNLLYADTAATLEQVQNLNTALEVAEADLKIARFNQAYAKIIAPTNGRILRRFTENNELVSPGTPLFRLASNNGKGFILKIGVADKDVIRLRLNDKAEAWFDAYPGETFEAYVSEIAEAADARTGAFEVELTISPNENILKNGFIGKVKVYPSSQKSYYRIDMNALVEGYEDRVNIFVPDDSFKTVKKIAVRPEYIGDGFFTIPTSQLPDNSLVITDGAAYLNDGAQISIVKTAEENAITRK